MEIKDIHGNILINAFVTESAVKTEELMKQDSITLSWKAITADELPLGAYIEYDGVKYSLLAPYRPRQIDEATYEYAPVFHHPVMRWQHLPFFFYSNGTKETDWSLTDNPANFMDAVCEAISQETGENWSYSIASNLAASASLSFSNTDIFSALNSIASAFETEWWFDYANKELHLSKASKGSAVTLEVGKNISVPSATESKEGYATRFYVFGSTRNIDQQYSGSNVNSIVNRRLTLNPAKYPNGYIDIRQGLTNEEVLVKTLVFDDIYPRSSLTISDVRVRLMWRLNDNNQKVQIGTDSEGNPVYDQYAIWYFKIPSLSFSKDSIISGKALSVHFNSGSLSGREFELTYHEDTKELENSDGVNFTVEAGDFEINFIEEGTFIIPAITGLIPIEGDSVTLFNINMPQEYVASAYNDLEDAAKVVISEQSADFSNYSFESNPVEFFNSNPNLSVGRNVSFISGDYAYSTRVIKLETQLDRPFEQKITIGNQKIKGNTQELKEEVVNVNQNVDLLASINETTNAFQQSLQRTQKLMQEYMSIALFERINVGTEEEPKYAIKPVKFKDEEVGIVSDTFITAGGRKSESEDEPQGSATTLGGLVNVEDNVDAIYDKVQVLVKLANATHFTLADYNAVAGLDEEQLKEYLDKNAYLNKTEADNLYATLTQFNALKTQVETFLDDENLQETLDRWKEIEEFLKEYIDGQSLAELLNAKADKSALEDLSTVVSSKADQSSVDSLSDTVSNKANKSDVSNLSNTVNGILSSVSGLSDDLSTLSSTVSGLSTTVNNKADKTEISGLSTTVENLRISVNDLLGSVANNVDSISQNSKDIEQNAKDIATNSTVITNLGKEDTRLSNAIDTLSNNMDELSTEVTRVSNQLGNKLDKADISGLSTTVDNLRIDVDNHTENIEDLNTNLTDHITAYNKHIQDYNAFKGDVTDDLNELMSMFEWQTVNGVKSIKAKAGLWSDSFITAGGAKADSGSGGGLDYFEVVIPNMGTFGLGSNGKVQLPSYPEMLPASDVYAWAKAASKPSYSFSEINGKPKTLNGYGITDAITTSGGTITGGYGALIIKRDGTNSSLVKFTNTNGILGMLGFLNTNEPVAFLGSDVSSGKVLLHAGNYANYVYTKNEADGKFFGIDVSADGIDAAGIISLNKGGYGYPKKGWWGSGPALAFGSTNGYTALIQQGANSYTLHVSYKSNGGNIQEWKTLAFTDSNVSAAQSLKHSNGTVGAIVSSAGDVGIGTSSPSYKLDVRGIIHTSERLNVYKWSGDTLQGGFYALINDTNGLNLNFLAANQASSLRNKDYNIVNYTGGNVIISRADQWDTVLSAISIMKGSIGVTASKDKNIRYLLAGIKDSETGDYPEIGYFEVAGMNFAITSKEQDVNSITGVTFDWKKDINNLELNRVYYDAVNKKAIKGEFNLKINGNFIATGEITAGSASDRRLKDNIQSMTDTQATRVLKSLNPVTFQWNALASQLGSHNGYSDGFIADEYEVLIPNSGRSIWTHYRAIDYTRVSSYLVKGWQNHETRLEAAERRIKELETELSQYRRA